MKVRGGGFGYGRSKFWRFRVRGVKPGPWDSRTRSALWASALCGGWQECNLHRCEMWREDVQPGKGLRCTGTKLRGLGRGGRASQQTNVFPNVNELKKLEEVNKQTSKSTALENSQAQGTTRFSMEDSGWTSGRGVERMLTFNSRFSRSFFFRWKQRKT